MKPKLLSPALILRLSLLLIIGTALSYAENTPIKVMSFNIRNGLAKDGENAWPLRQDFVVETIRTFDPDLLGGPDRVKAAPIGSGGPDRVNDQLSSQSEERDSPRVKNGSVQ